MELTQKKTTRRTLPLVLMSLAIGLACACRVFTGTPTSLPPQPVTPPSTEVQPSTPIQPEPSPPAPWMIIRTTDGLWTANSDGSGLLQLVPGNQWQSDFSSGDPARGKSGGCAHQWCRPLSPSGAQPAVPAGWQICRRSRT